MALINCPECNKQISDRAESCPHCGLPKSYFFQTKSTIKQKSYKIAPNTESYISDSKFIPYVNPSRPDQKEIESKLKEYKDYFDNMLKAVDPKIKLDDEQRRAILYDDKYCLLVAGAGAGKTMTMAAKVKFLIEKEKISPHDIIVISYTNKAIDELRERINDKLKIPVKISTFHSFGFEIVKDNTENLPTLNYSSYNIIFHYLEKKIFNNKKLLLNIVQFLGYYFELPIDIVKFKSLNDYCEYKSALDYETLKSRLGEYIFQIASKRSYKKRTITGEFLRSAQEVQIANFLYLHNIEYEYEKPYIANIFGSKKMYTPDFYIKQGEKICYIEHYGIKENFQSTLYDSTDLQKYRQNIIDKRKIHKQFGTVLIETWAAYNDNRSIFTHLKEELIKQGFELHPKDNEEVYKKLTETSKDKYVHKLITFLMLFIEKFKTNGYEEEEFQILREKSDNVRTRMFLDIAEEVYNYYQKELKSKNQIDFADMINEASKILKNIKNSRNQNNYKYIIIDEFQDIAKQRFNLTKNLADATGAKVMAVGDDWQSIFAFAGSDITLFQRFVDMMGSGSELFLNYTYRNSQELIDIAGTFIQKNSSQIKKRLISRKKLKNPIIIEAYDDTSNIRRNKIIKLEEIIEKIVEEFGKKKSILILGRYNFEKKFIIESGLFFGKTNSDKIVSKKFKNVPITYLTIHSSKGLGFDNVIIANMSESKYGFPSQMEDDPILKLVTHIDDAIPFSEERRLFYVAMTRTKNRIYLNVPKSRPSRFILELIQDFKIPYSKDLSLKIYEKDILKCPICNFPLRYENNKNYGIPLYMCSNEPEICDFMTNDKVALADIYKCPECIDGYMVVRKGKNDEDRFYGCTNYYNSDTQCKNMDRINVLRN